MKIPYFPGCTLKTNAKNFEDSAIAALQVMDIELMELPRWNCCGVVSSLTKDDLMHHLGPVRNLLHVKEMKDEEGLDKRLLTLCSMCYNTLKRSNQRVLEQRDDLDTINEFMYLEDDYDGSVEVIHLLQLLKEHGFDKVKDKVKKSLSNLKVAPYYGCMLLRPKEAGIDDPEEPVIFEDFLKSLSAEAIDWKSKSRCCGSYLTLNKKDTVVSLAHGILEDANKKGADVIVTSCPLCAFNLDNRQKGVLEKYPTFKTIPVMYFTQLMVAAFGLDIPGLDSHYINPDEIINKIK